MINPLTTTIDRMNERDQSNQMGSAEVDAATEDDWACFDDFGDLLRLEPGETPGVWELLDDPDVGAQPRRAVRDYPEFYRHFVPNASLPHWLDYAMAIGRLGIDVDRISRVRLRVDRVSRPLVPLALRWMRQLTDLPCTFALIEDEDRAAPDPEELLVLIPGETHGDAWINGVRVSRRRQLQVVTLLDKAADEARRFSGEVLHVPVPKAWSWAQCGAFTGHLFALYALALRIGHERNTAAPSPDQVKRAAKAVHADLLRLPGVWSALHSVSVDIASAGRLALLGHEWTYDLCLAYAPLIRRFAGLPCIAIGSERTSRRVASSEIVPVVALTGEELMPYILERLAALPDECYRKILVTNAAYASVAVDAAECSVQLLPIGDSAVAPIGFALWLQMLTYRLGREFAIAGNTGVEN